MRVMTYNVHGFVGTDHVYDPERSARVIEAGASDIVALQEVDFGRGPRSAPAALERLAQRLDMRSHFTFTRHGKHGHVGNAVLTRHRFDLIAEGMLPNRRDEARAVQWLRVLAGDWQLELMNTHLSISLRERRLQARTLLGTEWLIRASSDLPLVICGDFNASPWSGVYRAVARQLRDVWHGHRRRHATWPSRFPFWSIDHIFVNGRVNVDACGVVDHALARNASDHLPLVASLSIPTGGAACVTS